MPDLAAVGIPGSEGAQTREPSAEALCDMVKFGGPHSSGARPNGNLAVQSQFFTTSRVKLVSSSSKVMLRFQPTRASLNTLEEKTCVSDMLKFWFRLRRL